MEQKDGDYLKGRGSQLNTSNPYLKNSYVKEHPEGLDEPWILNKATQYFYESPKKVVNKVDSPDLGMGYSINPYQGCEHGCIYCYARNSHQYWGFSAGIDFESKIIVKRNAAELLEKQFQNKNWKPEVIMVSGNTDCYQPVERKLKITRSLLEVFLKYRNPVGIITKNSLILRDLDILKELAKLNLVHVMVSITSLKEEIRLKMEPRTATAKNRLNVIGTLSANGIPAGVMTAPIVPGINSDEIPAIIEAAAEKGADCAGYTIVRLNGSIGEIFSDWIHKAFPDKAEKVLNHIKECHGGQLNDSRWGTRMRGEGKIAESIRQLFSIAVKKHIKPTGFSYDYSLFRVPANGQLDLFDKEIF
jgi:DNA repair photolyase